MPETPKIRREREFNTLYVPRCYATQTTRQGVTTVLVDVPPRTFPGIQITESEGHSWPARKGRYKDVGGDFWTLKKYVRLPVPMVRPKEVDITYNEVLFPGIAPTVYKYKGPVLALNLWPLSGLDFPPSSASTIVELDALGAIAVSRCKPTNSVANASQFLGELVREGVPSFVGTILGGGKKSQAPGNLGSEYLNYQFGWKPIISDVEKFLDGVQHASKILKQYERDSGKVVRRRYEFPSTYQVTETTKSSDPPWIGGANASKFYSVVSGNSVKRRETTRRRWFSGAFTYHLPTDYDSRKALDRYALMAEKVFGLTLTPEVIWNLAPWTWAVDWFSSAGAVVSNLSSWSNDGLVMRYGYIMEHTIVVDTYTNVGSSLRGISPHVPSISLVTETKQRRRANPFGFGVVWDGLSPYQLSIAAALGLSKSR